MGKRDHPKGNLNKKSNCMASNSLGDPNKASESVSKEDVSTMGPELDENKMEKENETLKDNNNNNVQDTSVQANVGLVTEVNQDKQGDSQTLFSQRSISSEMTRDWQECEFDTQQNNTTTSEMSISTNILNVTPSSQMSMNVSDLYLKSPNESGERNYESTPVKRPKIIDSIVNTKDTKSGLVTGLAKVYQIVANKTGAIVRIADEATYIDIVFDNFNDCKHLVVNKAYNFIDFYKAEQNSNWKYSSQSKITMTKRAVTIKDDIPKINVEETFSTGKNVDDIVRQCTRDMESGKNKYFNVDLIAIIAERYDLEKKFDNMPAVVLNVADQRGTFIKIKLYDKTVSEYGAMLVEKEAYLFSGFQYRFADGKIAEHCLTSNAKIKIEKLKVEFTVPKIPKLYIVNVIMHHITAYKICGVDKKTSLSTNTTFCNTCKMNVEDSECYAAFYCEVIISDDRDAEDGKVYKIFDDSLKKLVKIPENLPYLDVKDDKKYEYEALLYEKTWEVSGEIVKPGDRCPIFNIYKAVQLI